MSSVFGEMIVRSGSFSCRFAWDWAKWPDHMKGIQVCGVACDAADSVYALTRSPEWPIAVFDTGGNFLRAFGQGLFDYAKGSRAHGIFVARDGSIWCCDDGAHVAFHLSQDGKVISSLGDRKPSDSGYDPSTPWPKDLLTIRRAAPPFNRPTKVIQAASGDLYATDGYGNASVHRFTADGKLIRTWGGAGDGPGCFLLPHGLWVDCKNRVWVADREHFRIQIFTIEGDFIESIDDPYYPSEMWSDGTYMYVADLDRGITIFDEDAQEVASLGYPGGPLCPHGIGGDSRGNLYLGMVRGALSLAKLEKL